MNEWSEPVRVVIADDHALVRRGTREILEACGSISVVGEAGNGIEAVDLAVRARPHVALLDVAMPRLGGVAAAREIARVAPDVRILMLTVHGDIDHLLRAIRAGVAGYVLKTTSAESLVNAVLSVAGGGSFLDSSVTHLVLERVRFVGPDTQDTKRRGLTTREIETLGLAATGLTNKEIADRLDVSSRTVEVHLYNAYAKLRVSSRTEAVLEAMRRGLIAID